jgi:hypothetical protein
MEHITLSFCARVSLDRDKLIAEESLKRGSRLFERACRRAIGPGAVADREAIGM